MANHNPDEMRQHFNLLISKLSDRDTESMAAAQLNSIAQSLTPQSLPLFISAITNIRPTDKTSLRRHSLRLLSLLATSLPPPSLAPHLPRIVAAALRRLRDRDSSVRTALVAAVRSLAAASPVSALIPVILRPLADALFHEQDLNAQSVSAYSLAAALDASGSGGEELIGYVGRLVPRLVKLARSPAFKAKAAIMTLLGSAGGGGGDDDVLDALVGCFGEFVGCEDWSARKAAAEGLGRLAVVERDRLGGFKASYLASFESRRFDKVKIVRDSMNRMIELWKKIPDPDQPNSLKENAIDNTLAVQSKKNRTSRSPPPNSSPIPSIVKKIVRPSSDFKPNSALTRKIIQAKNSDWKIEISSPDATSVLFEKKIDVIRVAPLQENESLELTGENGEVLIGEQKNCDFSLIRMQLVQIEKQQSNLLQLLQKFIGSSQNGINSLEARVNNIEMALDEISAARSADGRPASKTCCRLPGTEFLSSKFWKRIDGRYAPRFLSDMNDFDNREAHNSYRWNKEKLGFTNPLAEISPCSR